MVGVDREPIEAMDPCHVRIESASPHVDPADVNAKFKRRLGRPMPRRMCLHRGWVGVGVTQSLF